MERLTLMRTVIGLFETVPEALYALEALRLRKYDRSDISVVADDLAQLHGVAANIVGLAAGRALNLVAGLSAFGIPGVGPILAAPSLLVVVGEATADSDEPEEDWLIGELRAIGVPRAEAAALSQGVHKGGAVVLVRAPETQAANIAALLVDCGAVDVAERLRPDPDARSPG